MLLAPLAHVVPPSSYDPTIKAASVAKVVADMLAQVPEVVVDASVKVVPVILTLHPVAFKSNTIEAGKAVRVLVPYEVLPPLPR